VTDDEGREPAGPDEPTEETQSTESTGRRGTIIVVAVVVALLAAVGVVVYLMTSGDDEDLADPDPPTITGSAEPTSPLPPAPSEEPSTPAPAPSKAPPPPGNKSVAAARTVAEQAAAAIEGRDVRAMERLACDPNAVGTVEDFPPDASARLVANPEITGDKATAQVELTIEGSEPTIVPLPLENRGGTWCVP